MKTKKIVFLNKHKTKWIETINGFKQKVQLTCGTETLERTILYYKMVENDAYFAISYNGSTIDLRVGTTDITEYIFNN